MNHWSIHAWNSIAYVLLNIIKTSSMRMNSTIHSDVLNSPSIKSSAHYKCFQTLMSIKSFNGYHWLYQNIPEYNHASWIIFVPLSRYENTKYNRYRFNVTLQNTNH